MIKAEIWSEERCTIYGPFPFPFIKLVNSLAGKKNWDKMASVKIEGTPNNLRILQSSDYQIEFIDKTGVLTEQERLQTLPTQHAKPSDEELDWEFNDPPYPHQDKAIRLSWFREFYALLFDVGLGKTFILIVTAGLLYLSGKVTGVLVLAPKGVHKQWIEEEIPRHMDKRIPWMGIIWKKKKITEWVKTKKLVFFSLNTDAIRTKDGLKSAKSFMAHHAGKVALFVDESHDFKNQASSRTIALFELGEMATYRRIATGTPQARNIVDLFTQFNFLSLLIIGCKYLSSFKARYCILSPHDGETVVAQKNTEELYSLIAPHSFRLTQEEALDLPPKIYVTREYEMGDDTRKHYDEMKKTLLTEMSDGTIVDGVNAAVAMLRLHQIVCGHLPGEDTMHRFGGERIEALMGIVRQTSGPVVIWARFIEDRNIIVEALKKMKETFVVYAGTDDERRKKKDDFLNGLARIFLSNQRSGGTGLNLQGHCATVIYFSNSFNAVDRWQSEGRTMRIGTLGTVTYFDIVASKSVDRAILRNLKNKKDLAALTLDEIRKAIISEE